MKILLIGDYSGVHANLAIGLRRLGHEVVVASDGDGDKAYSADIFLPSDRRIERIKLLFQLALKSSEFDVVQFMNPCVLSRFWPLYVSLLSIFRKNVSRLFLCAGGCDYTFHTLGAERLLEMPLFVEMDKQGEYRSTGFFDKLINSTFLHFVDGVIPLQYEYYVAYKDHPKSGRPILFPFDLELLPPTSSLGNQPNLIFYHSASSTRAGFKGSYHIREAFKKADSVYANRAQFVYGNFLPYKEYQSFLNKNKVGIIFDQTNGLTYGMNALLGWGMGKIVGIGMDSQDSFWESWASLVGIDLKDLPWVPLLKPSSEIIFGSIEKVLSLTSEQRFLEGEKARKFVIKYHDCVQIAEKFVDRWKNTK